MINLTQDNRCADWDSNQHIANMSLERERCPIPPGAIVSVKLFRLWAEPRSILENSLSHTPKQFTSNYTGSPRHPVGIASARAARKCESHKCGGTSDNRNVIQGHYKRNKQFQHFIKPRLFKISTLTMHGFVEKLWKFVTATCRCSMCAPLVTLHISTR
jgi:hypothetical protein